MVFSRRVMPLEVMDAILLLWLGVAILIGAVFLWFNRPTSQGKKPRASPPNVTFKKNRKSKKRR